MGYKKTILCLAASRKHLGKCFAGKCVDTGKWIRPVSAREKEEISAAESLTKSGPAELIDILEIDFSKKVPKDFQTENHLIDPTVQWQRKAQGKWSQILGCIDEAPGPLWANDSSSMGYQNNRVAENAAKAFGHSLLMIKPQSLRVSIYPKGGNYGDAHIKKVKAHFSHNKIEYVLSVTDPAIEDFMTAGKDRTEDMSGAAICISLGEIYRGYAYKLVAGIIRKT